MNHLLLLLLLVSLDHHQVSWKQQETAAVTTLAAPQDCSSNTNSPLMARHPMMLPHGVNSTRAHPQIVLILRCVLRCGLKSLFLRDCSVLVDVHEVHGVHPSGVVVLLLCWRLDSGVCSCRFYCCLDCCVLPAYWRFLLLTLMSTTIVLLSIAVADGYWLWSRCR